MNKKCLGSVPRTIAKILKFHGTDPNHGRSTMSCVCRSVLTQVTKKVIFHVKCSIEAHNCDPEYQNVSQNVPKIEHYVNCCFTCCYAHHSSMY